MKKRSQMASWILLKYKIIFEKEVQKILTNETKLQYKKRLARIEC